MFSLIAVVCQGFTCVTFTPPKVYVSERACMEDAVVLYQVVQDTPDREIVNMDCFNWGEDT
tara:strand:+ start:471 stop:653 length:183 start_codon:yes stop_codon:yes gene_type:complete